MSKVDSEKPSLYNRLVAYIIDTLIISFIASLLAFPFTNNKEMVSIQNEYMEKSQKYINKEISINEYTADMVNIQYDIAKNGGFITITTIFLGICYFVIYQMLNNGQTIGKKIMKIRVISTSGELSANQMIMRSFIANNILLNIISILLLLFTKKTEYFYCYSLFSLLQYIITCISFFMFLIKKEGLTVHDKLVHTKVIKIN